jgi:hypothetical protein
MGADKKKPNGRLSLHPLRVQQALEGMLNTKPPKKDGSEQSHPEAKQAPQQ